MALAVVFLVCPALVSAHQDKARTKDGLPADVRKTPTRRPALAEKGRATRRMPEMILMDGEKVVLAWHVTVEVVMGYRGERGERGMLTIDR